MTTIITTILGVAFAASPLVSFVLAGVGLRRLDDLDNAMLFAVGTMFGWSACAMLFGLGVG